MKLLTIILLTLTFGFNKENNTNSNICYDLYDDFTHPNNDYIINLDEIFCNTEIKKIKSKAFPIPKDERSLNNGFPTTYFQNSFIESLNKEPVSQYFINAKSKIINNKLIVYDYTGQGILRVELDITDKNNLKEKKSFNLFVLDNETFFKKEYNIKNLKIIINHTWEENLGWGYGIPYYKIYKDNKLVKFEIGERIREYSIDMHNNEYYLISQYERGAPWYQRIVNNNDIILSDIKQMEWKDSDYTY